MGKARKFLGYNNAERHQEQRGLNRNLNTFSLPQSNPRPSQTAKPDSLYMKRSGGQFTGPFGSTDLTRTISSGKLNIGSSDGAALDSLPMHRRYFLDPEGAGTTDTLDMIDADGKEMDGMEIILMGIGTNVITITHNSGSASGNNRAIICPGNSDYTLSNEEAAYLIYDAGNTQWILLGAASDRIIDGDSEVLVSDGGTSTIYFTIDNTDYYWITADSFKLINAGSKIDLDGKDIISSSAGSEIGSFTIPITSMYSNDYQVYDTGVPNIDFWRDDSTPNDDDIIGLINFYGENSSSTKIPFVGISATMQDVTAATEDSSLEISLYTAGNTADRFILDGQSKTVQLYDGWAYKAIGTTEIGYQVTNNTLTVGSKGSMEAPILAQTDTPTDATLDGFFGNTDGCIGFWRDVDSDANSRGFVRMNSVWYYWFLVNL